MDIINNTKNQQFEYHKGDQVARLEYRYYKNCIAFMHTFVPEDLEGQGIASALVRAAFSFAKTENKSVMVYCPFVKKYVEKHPELKDQLNKEYHN